MMEMEFIRIDSRLVRQITKTTGVSVKAQAIRKVLEEFLREKKRKRLKKLAGQLQFYTQADLKKMREDE